MTINNSTLGQGRKIHGHLDQSSLCIIGFTLFLAFEGHTSLMFVSSQLHIIY